MKTISYSNRTLVQISFFAILLVMVSCNSNPKQEDTKVVAEDHNEAKFDTNKQEKDAQFLVNAAEIDLEEIQLGQLAQQRGVTTHVKELGKMMETAHRKSLNDLTALARSKNISIPTSPTEDAQKAYKNLNDKSGDDFDQAYADRMVSEHKDAIEDYEDASNDANDTDIKNWATSSLSGLRTHLDHSLECQKKCEKM